MAIPPTMTLHECAEAFRANQIPVSEAILARGIEDKVFPFALALPGEKRGVYMIFREEFYEWLSGRLHKQARRLAYEQEGAAG